MFGSCPAIQPNASGGGASRWLPLEPFKKVTPARYNTCEEVAQSLKAELVSKRKSRATSAFDFRLMLTSNKVLQVYTVENCGRPFNLGIHLCRR